MRCLACVSRVSRAFAIALVASAIALTAPAARSQQAGQPPQQPPQQPPAPNAAGGKVTYDKSLAPDGKPWTADTLIAYWQSQRPDLPFKVVERLELSPAAIKSLQFSDSLTAPGQAAQMVKDKGDSPAARKPPKPKKLTPKEAALARREKEQVKRDERRQAAGVKSDDDKTKKSKQSSTMKVYSETPLRKSLLAMIEQQHHVKAERKIVDLAGGRQNMIASKVGSVRRNYFAEPEQYANDRTAQTLYWIDAVEVIDFQGNEEAARDYIQHFEKEKIAWGFQWHGITLTGDGPAIVDFMAIMLGRHATRTDSDGETKRVKLEGYKGYPVASP